MSIKQTFERDVDGPWNVPASGVTCQAGITLNTSAVYQNSIVAPVQHLMGIYPEMMLFLWQKVPCLWRMIFCRHRIAFACQLGHPPSRILTPGCPK